MSGTASRAHSLGPGAVVVRGAGAAAELLARHLGDGDARSREVVVEIDLVDHVAEAQGVTVRARRGRAIVVDGDPVRVVWERRLTTMRPLVAAAHLAARRRRSLLVQGATVRWADGPAVLFTGPPGAGKTGAFLAALDEDAVALGPDWGWVDVDTSTLWALPQPVRVRAHHLSSPSLRGSVPRWRRLAVAGGGRIGGPARARSYAEVPLARLGGPDAPESCRLGAIVILGSESGTSLPSSTADGLAGTASAELLAALTANVTIVHVDGPGIRDALDAARQAVA